MCNMTYDIYYNKYSIYMIYHNDLYAAVQPIQQ